jgi:hypothetical protein
MLGIVSAETVSLGRQGRSKRPKLLIPLTTVKTVFSNDPVLFDLVKYVEDYVV